MLVDRISSCSITGQASVFYISCRDVHPQSTRRESKHWAVFVPTVSPADKATLFLAD